MTENTFADDVQRVQNRLDELARPMQSALQVMLAAAAAENATEQSVLDAIAPYLPADADTGRLRVLARGFIKDAGISRQRAEQTQKHLAVSLASYPHNLGPVPVIVDAAPFIDRPSVFTRKDAA